jgi:glycosyltransferase involved in cell wall biosynthesis
MIPDGKIAIIPNGVDTQIFDVIDTEKYRRKKYRLIYTSSYVRGLEHILMYGFPEIRRHIPEAELHIFYGRDLLTPEFERNLNKLLEQPGVFEHGRISHQDLAKEFYQATIHYYLTTAISAEIDCISVKESVYAGCIPILSTLAVFPERLGVHIEGDPNNPETQITAARAIISILTNEQSKTELKQKLKEFTPKQTHTWDEISQGWVNALQFPELK